MYCLGNLRHCFYFACFVICPILCKLAATRGSKSVRAAHVLVYVQLYIRLWAAAWHAFSCASSLFGIALEVHRCNRSQCRWKFGCVLLMYSIPQDKALEFGGHLQEGQCREQALPQNTGRGGVKSAGLPMTGLHLG